MKSPLSQYRFSINFNRLGYMGVWSSELTDPVHKALFVPYRIFCTAMLLTAISLQATDLYLGIGNFRKVAYNFSTSVIVFGFAIKITFFHWRKPVLHKMRSGLWKLSLKDTSPEDASIYDAAYKQLQNIHNLFYVSCAVVLPLWLICAYFSYKWGPRQLPFAAYLPLEDPLDDRYFIPALVFESAIGTYIGAVIIEAELAMFALILQLQANYQILSKNILKLNELYGDGNSEGSLEEPGKEVNPLLKRVRAREMFRSLIIRQLKIFKFVNYFEIIYNPCMLLQVSFGSTLIVMNGVELTMYSLTEINAKMVFQSGYTVLIMVDIFLICYHLTRLISECLKVVNAAYSTAWYNMGRDSRKSILLIMTRSQKPPKVTVGRLCIADLTTYLHNVEEEEKREKEAEKENN